MASSAAEQSSTTETGPSPAGRRPPPLSRLGRLIALEPANAYKAGDAVYVQDDPAGFVYEVVAGVVRTAELTRDGRRLVHDFFLPGEIFGLERNSVHSCSAEAVCEARVLRCGRGRLERLALVDQRAAGELWSWMMAGAERVSGRLSLLARGSAVQKIAEFLLEMSGRMSDGRRFELPMSRYDIADYLGLSSETVSRAFTALRNRGLIATSGRSVTLVRPDVLRSLNGGGAAPRAAGRRAPV